MYEADESGEYKRTTGMLQKLDTANVIEGAQQVGVEIWSWRVARVGVDYKIVDRGAEGSLQLG